MDPITQMLIAQGGGALLKGIGGAITSGKQLKLQREQMKMQEEAQKKQAQLGGFDRLSKWRDDSMLKSTRLDFMNEAYNVLGGQ